MKLQRPAAGAGAAIALTPLIDVVFILLIFFMLASRFEQWTGFAMALGSAAPDAADVPESAGTREDRKRSVVHFNLLAGDRVAVEGRILDRDAIAEAVQSENARTVDSAPAFGVRAEPGSSISGLVALLEDLKRAGAGDVTLVPAPAPAPAPAPGPAGPDVPPGSGARQ